jgi:adenylate kinase family enzyme
VPRIVVLGTSGSGKSTVAAALAAIYDVRHVDLDDLAEHEDFRARIGDVVAAPNWVIDGDYQRVLGDSVLAASDTAVWLDLPLSVSLARMWRRTLRLRLVREPSLVGWVAHEVRSHLRRRLNMTARLGRHSHIEVVHLRTQAEVDAWLAGLGRSRGPEQPGAK